MIPSHVILRCAIPSSANPSWTILSPAILSDAIPSSAIPSSAIPSSAIPSSAIPSSAIPSKAWIALLKMTKCCDCAKQPPSPPPLLIRKQLIQTGSLSAFEKNSPEVYLALCQ